MKNTPLIKQRPKIQKLMIKTFSEELQTLDTELRAILIDDMITAFCNRLEAMQKIQDKQ